MNDFDRIAPIYDFLAKVCFVNRINLSKKTFLKSIPKNSSILIVGGGSGKVLDYLSETNNTFSITYIEASERMINKARIRKKGNHNIEFIHADYLSGDKDTSYDVIICDFFLDLFNEKNLKVVISRVLVQLKSDGHVIVSDFRIEPGRLWHKGLSKMIHSFFKVTTQLDSGYLQNLDERLLEHGLMQVRKQTFFGQFIFSAIYGKI